MTKAIARTRGRWSARPRGLALAALGAVATMLGGCSRGQRASSSDSAFVAMQQRGRSVMGVDQYSSTHTFDDLPDGGRIVLQRDTTDTAGTRAIRDHLRHEAERFAAGDFADPAAVHARAVPGTAMMSARRAAIRYEFHELPRGGELRITTTDTAAVRAVHEFLAFQRGEHRAGGHAMPGMRMP